MLLRHGHGHTFVAVPCYGQLPAASAFSLLQLADCDCEIVCLVGDCHVDDARNLLISVFLHDSDCKQLLFVDADTFCEDWGSFISHDADVVGVGIPKKNDNPQYNVNFLPGPLQADSRGLIEVFDCGTGILKINRSVLLRLFEKSPQYLYDDRPCAEIFNRSVVNGRRMSGDLNFCRKWRELGGKIHIDPEMRASHTGEKTWQGTMGAFLRISNGLGMTYGIERIKSGTYKRTDVVELIEEWGNDQWAAGHELLAVAIDVARQAKGPIIETGSGVTSLCMAATGAEVHSLEHDPIWASKILEARERLGLSSLHVHYCPIENYPDGRWYGANYDSLPWKDADIVLCDGPPRFMSDRDMLFKVMEARSCRPRMILKDDTDDVPSVDNYEFEIIGKLRKFAIGRRCGAHKLASNY